MPEFKFILVIIIAVVVLLIAAVIITIMFKKKKKINIDEEYVRTLLSLLGGKSNISSIGIEGRKLKVVVNDLSIVDLDSIKNLAQAGVFVSGNNIKALFKYEASELNNELKKVIKEKW